MSIADPGSPGTAARPAGAVEERLYTPDSLADPYPGYAELRAEGPIHQGLSAPLPFLLRYADVDAVLRDPRWSADRVTASMDRRSPAMKAELCPYAAIASKQLLFADPPDHTRLRGLVSQAFTPRTVEAMRPRVETIVDDLLDRVAPERGMDAIRDLAYPLPATVILDLLGLPQRDRDRFKAWSTDFAAILANAHIDEQVDRRGQRSVLDAIEHIRGECDHLRDRPAAGLLGAMVLAEEEGRRLSTEELAANALLLMVAGHETTTNLIGNGLLALLRHPDQLQRLREEPQLIGAAVEELLRFDSPIQSTARIASEDVEIAGRRLPKGTMAVLLIGSANRDPARFEAPDLLDIGRPDNRHLSLGRGPHYCLGAALARLEGQVAIGAVVQRFPRLRLAAADVQWQPNFVFRGLRALPLTW
jgi:cytochrome P450